MNKKEERYCIQNISPSETPLYSIQAKIIKLMCMNHSLRLNYIYKQVEPFGGK